MVTIGERKYVLVGTLGSNIESIVGLQLIDVTDPLKPTPGGSVVGAQGDFALIDLVTDVSAVQIGGHHYALVASANVDGNNGCPRHCKHHRP